MTSVAYLFHPNHARGLREFVVSVRRDGTTTERTVWAPSSIDAWIEAQEREGVCSCRIEVKPVGARHG